MGEWLKIGATGGTGGAASPGNATLTAVTVLERYTQDGSSCQRLGLSGTAPSPVGPFIGVHIYAEIPDGSAAGRSKVGTGTAGSAIAGVRWEPLDLGKHPYSVTHEYLAVVSIPDVAQNTSGRFYAVSYSSVVENKLSYADESSPSPSILAALTPNPAAISGEEYAPLASGFAATAGYPYYELINNVWTYQLGFEWTAPASSPRYDQLSGYEIVFEYEDGSRSPVGPTPRDAVTWVSDQWPAPLAETTIIAWLCSVGAAGRNSIVEGVTPELTFTVQRPVDPTAGREYAPLLGGFAATAPKTTSVDGVEIYGFVGSWTVSTNPELDQVHLWAHETGGDTWHDLGWWLASDGEFRTDRWPLNGSPTFDLYALSVAPDGRENTLVDGVTPKVAGLTVTAGSGAIKANRIDAATLHGSLAVALGALGVAAGGVGTDRLAELAVTASKLAVGAVGSDQLASAAVTTAKLAGLAVDNSKLAALAVDAAKLAESAVTATKIANAAVGSAAIASAAIGSAHIANGSILSAHIGSAQIGSAHIASAAIGSAAIASAAIGTAHIQDAAITNAKIASLEAGKITAGTVTASVELQSAKLTLNLNGVLTTIANVFDQVGYAGLSVKEISTSHRVVAIPAQIFLTYGDNILANITTGTGYGYLSLRNSSVQDRVVLSGQAGSVDAYTEYKLAGSVVINASGANFAKVAVGGTDVITTGRDIRGASLSAISGFTASAGQVLCSSVDPYIGGYQYYGVTASASVYTSAAMLNKLIRWNGSTDLEWSPNGTDWYAVGSGGISLGYSFSMGGITLTFKGGVCTQAS